MEYITKIKISWLKEDTTYAIAKKSRIIQKLITIDKSEA